MTDNNFEYNNLLSKFKDLDKSNKNVSKSGKKKRSNKQEQKKEEDEEEEYGNRITTESKTEESTIDETAAAATADEADMDDNENVNNDKDDTNSPNDESNNNDNSNENDSNQLNNDDNDNHNDNNNDNNENENNNEKQDNITNTTESNTENNNNNNNNNMAANDDDNKQEEDSPSIEKWLQDNKLYNSELLVVLKANHVDTADDLKTFFEDADDLAGTIKSVRKRTEKVLAGFSKKVTKMTGVDYEYKAPRHRAKEPSNVSNGNSGGGGGAGLLNASGGGNGASGSPRGRSLSNSSQGSTGSIGSYTYRKHKGRPTPTGKEIQVEANAHNSSNLKSWLQSKNIFNRDLFMYLANHGYQAPDDLEVLTEKEFDKIVREVRVETFKDVDTNQKRNRVDKLLTKFEVEWRKLSGNRKTNMTKEQQEQWGYSPRTASQRKKDEQDDDDGFFS